MQANSQCRENLVDYPARVQNNRNSINSTTTKTFVVQEYDIKNLPFYKLPGMLYKILSSYRSELERPIFSMHADLVDWFFDPGNTVDVVLLHLASLGSKPVALASGAPVVGYLSTPPYPAFLPMDPDRECLYPTMLDSPPLDKLKTSFLVRVKNQMLCRFIHGYTYVASREMAALFSSKHRNASIDDAIVAAGDGMRRHGFGHFMSDDVPDVMLLGGPPLSHNVPLDEDRFHVLGIVDSPKPREVPHDLRGWLDARPAVLYVSMGTKYEIQESTCKTLVSLLNELVVGDARDGPLGVLWSLRRSQQEKLGDCLSSIAGVGAIKIVEFTPQAAVLKHPSVKVFLSHCGWGGVTDAISAGVPVLGYPGMSDQFLNARMLEEAEAGIILNTDFSNLMEAVDAVTGSDGYAVASAAAGAALRSYGGLGRGIEIIESAARSGVGASTLLPRPSLLLSSPHREIDPFFETPQPMEKGLALFFYLVMLVVVPVSLLLCCGCAGRRLFRPRRWGAMATAGADTDKDKTE